MEKINKILFKPVEIYSLVFMRITFGSIMLWETYRYLSKGWIDRYYVNPGFNFKYYGFEWVSPASQSLMYALFYILGFLAFCIIIGAFYRITSILFVIGFSYVFLLDQAIYLNHFYMVILLGILLAFMAQPKDHIEMDSCLADSIVNFPDGSHIYLCWNCKN